MSRLVVVSNRLDLPPGNRAPGGLAVSLAATLRANGGLWFGWSGNVTACSGGLQRQKAGSIDYATVDLSEEEYRDFYHGYCNAVLWPLCHGLPPAVAPDSRWFKAYQEVNARYASLLEPLLEHGDLVWIHDYHLLPLGACLRAKGYRQPLGYFLHVPFPPLQRLAESRPLLDALLAYDLIGFQTSADCAAFREAARWRWGNAAFDDEGTLTVGERRVATGVFPLGVDVDFIQAEAARRARHEAAHWWPRGTSVPRLLGADRLDASKGLSLRLSAYGDFLAARAADSPLPDYLQFITPSRLALAANRRLQADLAATARELDAQHGRGAVPALRCVFRAVDHGELLGLLAAADAALVTPLKDGMNLLAKEYVAAQPAMNPGVLVLSTHAGAAQELEAALLVEPQDTQAMARTIAEALGMPLAERQERHQTMLAALRRNDLANWRQRFLTRLLDSRQQ